MLVWYEHFVIDHFVMIFFPLDLCVLLISKALRPGFFHVSVQSKITSCGITFADASPWCPVLKPFNQHFIIRIEF